MRRNRAQNVILHHNGECDFSSLCDRVNAFHVAVIESRLSRLPLAAEQKAGVIDNIIKDMKSREDGGFIK